jgi:hypothetical protein
MRASIGFGFAIAMIVVVACGGDDSDGGALGDGCTTDAECKGDRICVDKECVDPSGGDGDGDGDGDAGEGGTSGASGASGSGNGGSGGRIDDPALEAACSATCEARDAAGCEMDLSLDQCLGQCLIIDEINSGYCLDEQREQYACNAAGGYTCVMGYPQPQSTCIAELTALSQCQQLAPCRMFCDQVGGECAASGEECVTECQAKQMGFADAICGIYYSQLLSCWAVNGVECDGDRPAVGACGPQVAEIADCIALRNTECEGYCWAAEALGCGSSECVTDCQAKVDDSSCGSYYRNVISCSIDNSRELNASCDGGELVPDATECASQIEQHAMCMSTAQ